jgi:hypothetical protein
LKLKYYTLCFFELLVISVPEHCTATKKIKERTISVTKPGKLSKKGRGQRLGDVVNKRIKRSARRDWRKYLDGLAEEAQSAASMGHISKVYKAINKLSCKPAHPRVPVKDKAGKVLTNMEEQLRRWS